MHIVSRKAISRIVSTIAVAITALLLLSASASAQNTLTVDSLGDDPGGVGNTNLCLKNFISGGNTGVLPPVTGIAYACTTLRDAILTAQSGDTIDLTSWRGTFTLSNVAAFSASTLNVTLKGPGPDLLTIAGGGITGGTVHLTTSGLTFSSSEIVTQALNASNMAFVSSPIGSQYFTTLTDSTLMGSGSGISGGQINVDNCTFVSAGGMFDFNAATVTNSTFVGSTYPIRSFLQGGTLNLANSIITGSVDTHFAAVYADPGTTITESNNLFFNNAGGDYSGFTASPTDIFGKDPLLSPLGYYGGSTQTILPLQGSPAVCAGLSSAVPTGTTTDQRGFPISANQCAGSAVSLGSVQPSYLVVNTTNDANDGSCGATCSLRDAINVANASTSGVDILFSNSLKGGTITLGSSLPTITANANIIGPGANNLTVSGANSYNVFSVGSSGSAAISGLTVADGSGSNGGGAVNSGSLRVTNSAFSDNSGATGGAISNTGLLIVTNTTFSANTATGSNSAGGIFNLNGGVNGFSVFLNVSNSTFAGNVQANLNPNYNPLAAAILATGGAILTVKNNTFFGNSGSFLGGNSGVAIEDDISFAGSLVAGQNFQNFVVQLQFSNNIFTGSACGVCLYYNPTDFISLPPVTFAGDSNNLFYQNTTNSALRELTNLQNLTLSTTDLIDQDPILASLGNYGGSTQTLLPLPGSPAICGGNTTLVTASAFDQRGFPRTTSRTGSAVCADVGAVETNYQSIQFTNAGGGYTANAPNQPATPAPNVTVTENGNSIDGIPITLTFNGFGNPAGLGPVMTASGGGATFTALTADSGGTDLLSATLEVTPTITLTTNPSATLTINGAVTPAPTTVTIICPSSVTYNGTPQLPCAATVTGTGGLNQPLSVMYANNTNAGTATASASFPGNANYSSSSNTANFTISQATPLVTQWPTASPITSGQMLGASQLTGGSASVGGAFSWTIPSTLLNVGTQPASVTFVPTDTVDYSNVTGTVSVTVNPAIYVVTVSGDDVGTASNCTAQSTAGHGTDASCSLRDALLQAAASGGGNITFDATVFSSPTTITLSNGTLTVPATTTITGATSGSGLTLTNLVAVDGNNKTPVFLVNGSVTASIANLIIQHGGTPLNAGDGAGIINAGNLTLIADSVINNFSSGNGGGISNSGALVMTASTVSGNIASCLGACSGGQGGGIWNSGSMTLTDDTISGNQSGGSGGAIYMTEVNSSSLSIAGCTISGNTAGTNNLGTGGGIVNIPGPTGISGAVTLANTILSGNIDGDLNTPSFQDGGGNVLGMVNGAISNSTAVNLAPVGSYGGPTPTMVPMPGSPAICAGQLSSIPSGLTTDQRGLPNTGSYPGNSNCVDAGAVKTNYAISFSGEPPAQSPAGTNFAAAVTLTESGVPFARAVTIPLSLTTGSGTLSGGSAATSSGIANYTLQVSSPGTGDQLTANLTLNSSPAVAISAVSSSFAIASTTPTVSFTGAPTSAGYNTSFTVATTTNASTTATITASGACSNAGNLVTMTSGTGTCSLQASWAADSNYSSATATQTTAATMIAPTVTFTGAPTSAGYKTTFTVATTTNASTTPTITASGGACSIAGTVVTMTSGTGTCSLGASWAADSNYTSATATQATTAAKIAPTVSFTGAPPSAGYKTNFTLTATTNASSTAAITASGACSILGTAVTMTSGTGTCSSQASWAADSNYTSATAMQATTAAKIAPTVNFTGAPASSAYKSTFTVSAMTNATTTATITASGACSIAGNLITMTSGAGTCSLGASWAADNNYNSATATQTTAATPAAQTITWASIGPQAQGGTVTLSATGGGSGNPVVFSSLTPLVCTVPSGAGADSPSAASLIAPGSCTITANQAGNTNYFAAPQDTMTFSVTAVFVLTANPITTTATHPGSEPVTLTLTPVKSFTGPVRLNCVLPASLPTGAKCPGLPVTVNLTGGAAVVYATGVLLPNTTKAGTYVVMFTAVDTKFNDSTTVTFVEK